MRIVLQVALDLLNGHRAIKIAEEAVEGGADWLEAGTPLIKSEGMNIVRELRTRFPDTTLVADLKTMDTGALETEMASKAGADIICVLGLADDTTILEAVRSAGKYGSRVMVDLIGVPDVVKRAQDVERLGVHFLCLHVGIDEQMIGRKPMVLLSELVKNTRLPVAVAGGLNTETIPGVIKNGASIIIVGGAINRAKDVKHATGVIKKTIESKKSVKTDLFKKDMPSKAFC